MSELTEKRIASLAHRVATETLYKYDPDHKTVPQGPGWHRTPAGWSNYQKPAPVDSFHMDEKERALNERLDLLKTATPEKMDALSYDSRPSILKTVAESSKTPQKALDRIVSRVYQNKGDEWREVAENCAKNKMLSPDTAKSMFDRELNNPDDRVLRGLAKNDNVYYLLDDERLNKMATCPNYKVREDLYDTASGGKDPYDDQAYNTLKMLADYVFEDDDAVGEMARNQKLVDEHYYISKKAEEAIERWDKWMELYAEP